MSDPLVSIVLPVYNGERYLADAIDSCLNQTYGNIELILVDDHSSDRTPEIIEKSHAEDRRVRAIRHDRNRRLPAGLNTGFAAAAGELLTWTSDDNRYRPEAIETMVGFLRARPDVGMVYASFTKIDDDGNLIKVRRVPPMRRLLHGNGVGACFLYRREVAEQVGPYAEDLVLAEDYDYWLRISKCARLEPLQKDLYFYRRHEKSLTTRHRQRIAQIKEVCWERHLPDLPWVSNAAKARQYLRMARRALARGEHEVAKRRIALAADYGPLNLFGAPLELASLLCGGQGGTCAGVVWQSFRRRGRAA